MGIENWSTTASENDDADIANGVDLREGMNPSQLNNTIRAIMAGAKNWYNQVGGNLPFQCRLVYVSTSSVRLDRCDGSWIFINGAVYQIPSTGPTLSNSGLSTDTTYYVYAYVSGATITLEASTTGYTTDSIYAHKVKSGDASRTLVGMVQTNSSGNFIDSASNGLVASYYNRRQRVFAFSQTTSTTSTSATAISSSCSVLNWGDEGVLTQITGSSANSGTGTCATQLGVDGVATGFASASAGTNGGAVSVGIGRTPTEGNHTYTAMISVSSGTGSYNLHVTVCTRI